MKLKNVLTITAMLSIVLITGCKKVQDPVVDPNIVSPTVLSSNPANAATAVALNQAVVVTFSEPMNPASITSSTFTLKQGTTSVAGAVSYTGSTATFTPSANLGTSKVYTGTITTGAKNVDGNPLLSNHVFSFTTGTSTDVILPVVNSSDPLDLAVNVSRNKVVSVNFSKSMTPSTINNTTFTLKQGATPVNGTVVYSGATATFTPSVLLTASTVYTATVSIGVKDLSGNALATPKVWSFTTGTSTSAQAVVNLGASGNYVILAKTAITNVPTSIITGDLGLSPAAASYITGFSITKATGYATSAQVTGKLFAADMAAPTGINLTTAVNNMLTAYTDAAGRPFPDFNELYTGNIGGKTLAPGLYKWTNSVTIPSNVTITGSATDVWIFQIAGDLSMSASVLVNLSGGALAKNIFWQVAGTVTFAVNSHFEGIILSKTQIILRTGASMNGRALAQTQVVLDKNTVTRPL
jgi:hypothetical protein